MLSRNKIKYLQTLQNKKNRQEAQFFVVEGKKILIETLESDVLVEEIYCTEEFFHLCRCSQAKKTAPLLRV